LVKTLLSNCRHDLRQSGALWFQISRGLNNNGFTSISSISTLLGTSLAADRLFYRNQKRYHRRRFTPMALSLRCPRMRRVQGDATGA
jgi:hypothetical protein